MLSTNQKGAIAETAIIAEAVRLGIGVFRPVVEGGRVDLVFAFADGSLARVQCKWAALNGATLCVRVYSARRAAEGMRIQPYDASEIDAIAAYCGGNGRCYYVPVARLAGHKVMHLRLGRHPQQPGRAYKLGCRLRARGYSSVGRALDWQSRGRGFESP